MAATLKSDVAEGFAIMLSTPSTSHVNFDNIYEPAEDSFLLLDTLSSAAETAYLKERFPKHTASPLVLEVGTGSGIVLAFVAAHANDLFGRSDLSLLATDLNLLAVGAAHGTTQRSLSHAHPGRHDRAGFLDVVAADLAGPVRHGQIDVLIFNPPYVPTEEVPPVPAELEQPTTVLKSDEKFDRDSKLLALSYAGGQDGMVVTNRLLEDIPVLLSQRGIAYILLCAQNKPAVVCDRVRRWDGIWTAEIVGHSGKTAGWERLCIMRVSRKEQG